MGICGRGSWTWIEALLGGTLVDSVCTAALLGTATCEGSWKWMEALLDGTCALPVSWTWTEGLLDGICALADSWR